MYSYEHAARLVPDKPPVVSLSTPTLRWVPVRGYAQMRGIGEEAYVVDFLVDPARILEKVQYACFLRGLARAFDVTLVLCGCLSATVDDTYVSRAAVHCRVGNRGCSVRLGECFGRGRHVVRIVPRSGELYINPMIDL